MSAENGDPLAQSVEHHTFNVGVLGSNPKRITKDGFKPSFFLFITTPRLHHFLPNLYFRVGKVGIIQAGIPRSEHGIRPTQYTEYQLIAHLTQNIISHIFIVLPIHTYLALARYR